MILIVILINDANVTHNKNYNNFFLLNIPTIIYISQFPFLYQMYLSN